VTELLDEAFRCGTGLLEAGEVRLDDALFFLIVESDLHGGVAFLFRGFDLKDGVAGDVDDGDGDHDASLLVEQAGHSEFFAEEAD
jgi:hypothetical protein